MRPENRKQTGFPLCGVEPTQGFDAAHYFPGPFFIKPPPHGLSAEFQAELFLPIGHLPVRKRPVLRVYHPQCRGLRWSKHRRPPATRFV